METIQYGSAEEGDIPSIQETARASWQATYSNIFPAEFITNFLSRHYSPESLRAVMRSSRSNFLVARAGARVIGFCNFGEAISGEGHQLYRLYLDPAYWRHGIGGKLLGMMEERLREQGVSAYFCYVHGENEVGKAFYVKQGFAHNPARDVDEEWFMRKEL
ncbi:MAG TPA: GNAT family N-acetyltransferase [Ardenticatenaceae bacterium]|jgi:ribosomal protein S18 acetylase RimI-like enzyme